MGHDFERFKTKFWNSCINSFTNLREKKSNNSHTTEQADNSLLRFATVITQVCFLFVLFLSSKR